MQDLREDTGPMVETKRFKLIFDLCHGLQKKQKQPVSKSHMVEAIAEHII